MKDVLISCVAFFTTTEADDPDLRVLLLLPLVWWPFTVLLLEAEDPLCLEPSFDALPIIFDDPFTSFDKLEEVAPLAVTTVSSLGLFSTGSGSVASVETSLNFVFGREDEDDWSEPHTDAAEALSLDSGGDSVLRFLCVYIEGGGGGISNLQIKHLLSTDCRQLG